MQLTFKLSVIVSVVANLILVSRAFAFTNVYTHEAATRKAYFDRMSGYIALGTDLKSARRNRFYSGLVDPLTIVFDSSRRIWYFGNLREVFAFSDRTSRFLGRKRSHSFGIRGQELWRLVRRGEGFVLQTPYFSRPLIEKGFEIKGISQNGKFLILYSLKDSDGAFYCRAIEPDGKTTSLFRLTDFYQTNDSIGADLLVTSSGKAFFSDSLGFSATRLWFGQLKSNEFALRAIAQSALGGHVYPFDAGNSVVMRLGSNPVKGIAAYSNGDFRLKRTSSGNGIWFTKGNFFYTETAKGVRNRGRGEVYSVDSLGRLFDGLYKSPD